MGLLTDPLWAGDYPLKPQGTASEKGPCHLVDTLHLASLQGIPLTGSEPYLYPNIGEGGVDTPRGEHFCINGPSQQIWAPRLTVSMLQSPPSEPSSYTATSSPVGRLPKVTVYQAS